MGLVYILFSVANIMDSSSFPSPVGKRANTDAHPDRTLIDNAVNDFGIWEAAYLYHLHQRDSLSLRDNLNSKIE